LKRLLAFVIVAAAFEAIALIGTSGHVPGWVVDVFVVVAILYAAFLTVKNMRKQILTDLPPSMPGKTVRKRHWHL
jgi:hypothetical protein